jgi:hypothetical protein
MSQTTPGEEIVPVSKISKHKEYARYAAHCLQMVPPVADQKYRAIQREMAAEWLKLADALIHPARSDKVEVILAGWR